MIDLHYLGEGQQLIPSLFPTFPHPLPIYVVVGLYIDRCIITWTASCNRIPNQLKSCNCYYLLVLHMHFQKSNSLVLSPFTKGAMDKNKQACYILKYWTCKYPKNRYFQHFSMKLVTQFAKIRCNDAFLEIQIFPSVSSIYLKVCCVVI